MSYIRSTSNPESLYIFGSFQNIEIMWNKGEERFHKYASFEDFYLLMDKYIGASYNSIVQIVAGDLTLEEEFVKKELKVVLRFKGDDDRLEMYPVTWDYVVNGYEDRIRHSNLFEKVIRHIHMKKIVKEYYGGHW